MPSTFDTSTDGEDVRGIIDSNNEFIEHLSAIQHVKFLPHRRTQAASRENCVLIIRFANPTTANCCIDCHVILQGRLLPTVKYVHCPPQCYSCYQEGHLACSCRQKPRCGLCAGEHNTQDCRGTWKEAPPGRFIPLKCPRCDRPHAAVDARCPVPSAQRSGPQPLVQDHRHRPSLSCLGGPSLRWPSPSNETGWLCDQKKKKN